MVGHTVRFMAAHVARWVSANLDCGEIMSRSIAEGGFSFFPVVTAAALGLLLASAPGLAQENRPESAPRIAVTGEGEARAVPDMAVMNLTVLREAETAREALTGNNEAMTAVLAALKQDGVAERDLQTTGLNIRPRYIHPNKDNRLREPKIVGYTVTNGLTVRIRELKAVGEVLDRSVTLGINQGGQLAFVNDDTRPILSEARKKAVADALDKARTLAEAAGVKLGKVLAMSEQSSRPRPIPLARQEAMAAAAPASVPVAAGENSYRITVSMEFAIEQ